MGTLTVRENLQFSAALRLPKTYSHTDRQLVVEEVIRELGLTQCASTKVRTQYYSVCMTPHLSLHPQSHSYTHTHSSSLSLTQALTLPLHLHRHNASHSIFHSHTLPCTLPQYTLTHSFTVTLSLTRSLTHTDTHLYSHIPSHSHSHSHCSHPHPCPPLQIGNQYTRGVSGGERKRTGIGMELVISPSILCLDEPTTGLDACAAVSVMQVLKE